VNQAVVTVREAIVLESVSEPQPITKVLSGKNESMQSRATRVTGFVGGQQGNGVDVEGRPTASDTIALS
jgi:hypothetical protein